MNKLILWAIMVIIVSGCTEKQQSPAVGAWAQWTEKLSDRYQERFASPSIIHHVYLERGKDKAYLNTQSSRPRLQQEPCGTCDISIRMNEALEVQVIARGGEENLNLMAKEPTRLTKNSDIFLSYYPVDGEEKVRVFVHDLSQDDLAKKRNRKFFDYQPEWVKSFGFFWLKDPIEVTIQRSDGSSKNMKKIGELKSQWAGQLVSLSVYNFGGGESFKNEDETMLLYRDYSNGKSTYGAGRFLNVKFPQPLGKIKSGAEVRVDFNYSYNPPCAVSTGFHCPLPQDLIKTEVLSGELYQK